MVTCPSCGQESPEGNFCIRCGFRLAEKAAQAGQSYRRGEFGASPHERARAPHLFSTLFPHLPHASLRTYHIALTGGVTAVLVLALLRLFPVALFAAALLVPLLTVLYLFDVDIYEDEPVLGVGLTLFWGVLAGVAAAILARTIEPAGSTSLIQSRDAHVVVEGVLLPLLGAALMLAGPLVLLPHRKFNHVLDGAIFGSVCAAAFSGAQVIAYGTEVLKQGLRPVGATGPWILRLLTISVALPVLAMAAIGAATAAIWVRFRAPANSRQALGVLGHPLIAIAIAAVLIVAGATGEVYFSLWLWLASLVALDVVALLLLRRAIHIGLLQESAEVPIGPPFQCANCGAQTARHSFCGNCGIALRALPKPRGSSRSATAPERPSEAGA